MVYEIFKYICWFILSYENFERLIDYHIHNGHGGMGKCVRFYPKNIRF